MMVRESARWVARGIRSARVSPEDWEQHYRALWAEFRKRKQRFDPDNILAPGLGIFA